MASPWNIPPIRLAMIVVGVIIIVMALKMVNFGVKMAMAKAAPVILLIGLAMLLLGAFTRKRKR